MKKIIAFLLCAVMLAGLLSGCASEDVRKSGRISIVTTVFPIYDWCREILGDQQRGVDLTMLLDSGVDLHSYQPTAADIIRISDCDVFIYVGGESDAWVEDALNAEGVNPDMKVISLLDALGDLVKEEEIVEGMEHDHDHEHEEDEDHEHEEDEAHDEHEEDEDHDHDHEEEPEYDEHVWLSVKNAAVLVKKLAEVLAGADPVFAEDYRANADAYCETLNTLDTRYTEAVAAGSKSALVFGDRFPFRYLADDYGLTYYAAFSGCSAETEASFQTVLFLAGKVDELGLDAVCQIESSDGSLARTVAENTASGEKKILTFDSLQSVTAEDAGEISYLSVMLQNLTVLQDALK